MATNKIQAGQDPVMTYKGAATHPATPSAGDPVRFGDLPGVALIDELSDGNVVADIGPSIFSLSVKGEDNAGDAAISAYDTIYYDDAGTPVLNIDSVNGKKFGIALAGVTSGSTSTIEVLVGRFQ